MNNNKKETFTKIKQIYSELLNKINVNKLDKKTKKYLMVCKELLLKISPLK